MQSMRMEASDASATKSKVAGGDTTASMVAESGTRSGKVYPEVKERQLTKSSFKSEVSERKFSDRSEPGPGSRRTIEVIVPVKNDKTRSSRKSEVPSKSMAEKQSRKSQFNATLAPIKRPSMAPRKSLVQDQASSKTMGARAVQTLPPCRFLQNRRSSSIENFDRPIYRPRRPVKFTPPFRRNFRYRGYPGDLNLDIDTPPRVRSWGPLDEVKDPRNPTLPEDLHSNLKPSKFRASPSEKFVADESYDPTWLGRTIKRNLLLANPGLLPILGKTNLEENPTDPVNIVKPTLDVTNCVSDLYFPLAEKSRKAFCRINKITKEALKKKHISPHLLLQEQGEPTTQTPTISRKTLFFEQPGVWKRHWSRTLEAKTSEQIFYEQAEVPAMMKMFCLQESARPGMNHQLYGRPPEKEVIHSDNAAVIQKPETGAIRMPMFDLELPDDVWAKLSKVRTQKQHRRQMQKKLLASLEDDEKFETFNQLELRNKVMDNVCQTFLEKFKAHADSPLPPELYEDNRDHRQPDHDFVEKSELPPQGPFVWKVEPEPPPTPEELAIVEKYIQNAKEQHTFTHHLPGRAYEVRHPYPHIELDWIAKDEVVPQEEKATKMPVNLHDYPSYVMNMSRRDFQGKLMEILEEGVEGVIGERVVKAFHDQRGLYYQKRSKKEKADEEQEEPELEEILAPEEVEVEVEAVASSPASGQPTTCSEARIKKGEKKKPEKPQSEKPKTEKKMRKKKRKLPGGLDRLSVDLLMLETEDEKLDNPLSGIRFSEISFPMDNHPPSLREQMKLYKKQMEKAGPIRHSQEDLLSQHDSDTPSDGTDIEQELTEDLEGSGETHQSGHSHSHNPLPRLQSLYASGVKSKYRSLHKMPTMKELQPPPLKNIWQEDYTGDIEHLLKQDYTQHSFSKYMLDAEL